MLYYSKMNSPVGPLLLAERNGRLVLLVFGAEDAAPQGMLKGGQEELTMVLASAQGQLLEYFEGQRKTFDVYFSLEGTVFQQQVWSALYAIPYGETRSYGQIASCIGKPGAARAVGLANNRNPLSIIIPCHRVIGADGKLVGYGGGLNIKRHLLTMEGIQCP